jgi:two-component system chemotaxis response regulator CheB
VLEQARVGDFAAFDVVVMAASLGGPSALRHIISALPKSFPAPVVVVQHRTARAQHVTVDLLRTRAALHVCPAEAGDRPAAGTVCVAPADRQLVLMPGGSFAYKETDATGAPPLRRARCDADPLFASAAALYGSRTIGVVLSGTMDDGAAGVTAIKAQGGRVLAQDRATALCFGMPGAAIATGCVDFVLPVEGIAPALVALTMAPGAAALFRVPLPYWAQAR